jgi:hypothetical protein
MLAVGFWVLCCIRLHTDLSKYAQIWGLRRLGGQRESFAPLVRFPVVPLSHRRTSGTAM